jgi:glutathione S-transferase
MPKLYYTPLSCAATCFITAFTAKVQLECEQIDISTHMTASGVDFFTVNPKGNVPCLVLNDGTVLNENLSILQFIIDQVIKSYIFHNISF